MPANGPMAEAANWLSVSFFFFFFIFYFFLLSSFLQADLTAMKVTRPKPSWHEWMWPCCWDPTTELIDVLWLSWSESELLGSNPVHTLLAFSFVEVSALGTKMFWKVLSKKCQTIRFWLAPGVKFGSGSGRLRFTERQQTGLADPSHWRNKITQIQPTTWVF